MPDLITEAAKSVSACISEKVSEGYSQDQAVAICLSMAERGELSSSVARASKSTDGYLCKAAYLKDTDVEGMEFSGYASTWDMDEVRDVIHRGAFQKSIRERFPAGKVKVLYQHDAPIGMPLEMREDSRGLYTRSRISDTAMGRDVMTMMKDGVIDALSIGFSIPNGKADIEDDGYTRHIHEVKLYEYSPVTFPANENALIEMSARLSRNHDGEHLSERAVKRIRDAIAIMQEAIEERASEPLKGTQDPEPDSVVHSIDELRQWAAHRLY